MRHSLLSRFQGTVLAAAWGEALGAYSLSWQATPPNGTVAAGQTVNPAVWHPGLGLESRPSRQPSVGGRMAVSSIRALIQSGGWHERALTAIDIPTSWTDSVAVGQRRASEWLRPTIAAELAIATLPLSLFLHEHERKQQQSLLHTAKLWRCPPGAEAGSLAVGYAIAQVLQERLVVRMLLPQTIAYLKQSTANPTSPLLELMDALEQAQSLLQQGAGLHTAIDRLWAKEKHPNAGAIALAFYCFLSTPDDLRLSLLRAARCSEAAVLVCPLTGALSGAYHGISVLPLAWQLSDTSCLSWGLADTALRQLTTQLFAAWSGVYAPAMPVEAVAIAAPGVIRPR